MQICLLFLLPKMNLAYAIKRWTALIAPQRICTQNVNFQNRNQCAAEEDSFLKLKRMFLIFLNLD